MLQRITDWSDPRQGFLASSEHSPLALHLALPLAGNPADHSQTLSPLLRYSTKTS